MAQLWTPGMKSSPLSPPGFVRRRRIIGHTDYLLNHPTRYRWNKHVELLIRKLYRVFGTDLIHINTYVEHPPEDQLAFPRRLDRLSFDVWDGQGRGWPLDYNVGQRVFNFIWNDPGQPYIAWIIWQATIRERATGFVPQAFGKNPLSWHYDHIHVTAEERSFRP